MAATASGGEEGKEKDRVRARKFMSRDVSTETLNFNVPVSPARSLSRGSRLSARAVFLRIYGARGGIIRRRAGAATAAGRQTGMRRRMDEPRAATATSYII